MSKIFGQFYFKRTSNGNLLGEYSNSNMSSIDVESANAVKIVNGFEGTYDTMWQVNKSSTCKILEIIAHPKIVGGFLLSWGNGGVKEFEGQGFIVDGMLIGSYKSI